MKVKQIITVTIFVLFLVSVAVFVTYGAQIRAALSPEIAYDYPVMEEVDGEYRMAVPASAVWVGEDGATTVWSVTRSDDFPESAYVVSACPVNVAREEDDTVYLGFGGLSSSDAVAVGWNGTLREGMCVKPRT